MSGKSVECNKCGWVHFEVTADYVRKWLKDWEAFWPTLSDEGKGNYGLPEGPPSVVEYLRCGTCGNNYKDFKDSTRVLNGQTIGGILSRDEEL